MKRSQWVLLGLVALVLAEIAVLVWLGRAIGVGPLLLVLIAEGIIGAWLVQREGRKAWRSVRESARSPLGAGEAISDAGLVVIGAILLAVPGFLTDLIGLCFLIPSTRRWAKRALSVVFASVTRRQRDALTVWDARLRPNTVVEGEAVPGGSSGYGATAAGQRNAPGSDAEGTVIRGEIAP